MPDQYRVWEIFGYILFAGSPIFTIIILIYIAFRKPSEPKNPEPPQIQTPEEDTHEEVDLY